MLNIYLLTYKYNSVTPFFEATGLLVEKVWFGNPSFLKDSRFSLGFPFGLEEKATVKRIPQGGGRQAVTADPFLNADPDPGQFIAVHPVHLLF